MSVNLTISKERSKAGFAKLSFMNKRGEKMPIVNGIPVNPPKPRRSQSARTNTNSNTNSNNVNIAQALPVNYNNQRVSQWVTRNGSSTFRNGPPTFQNQRQPQPQPTSQSASQPTSQPTYQSVQQPANVIGNAGIQNQLTETTFRQYLDGFVEITRADLPITPGGRLRYALDLIQNGRIVSTQYRLGGFVKSVSPDLSSVTLFNPFVNKTWTLQTNQPGKRVRLYFFKRPTSDEGALIRGLISKIQTGQVRLVKNY